MHRIPLTLPLLTLILACGPQVEDEEEARVFEHRRPTCALFCGIVEDPECGSDVEIYEDEEDCIDHCVSEDASYWRLQDDDTDACGDAFKNLYECAASATCEAQWIITNSPVRIAETPCEQQANEFLDCTSQHPE